MIPLPVENDLLQVNEGNKIQGRDLNLDFSDSQSSDTFSYVVLPTTLLNCASSNTSEYVNQLDLSFVPQWVAKAEHWGGVIVTVPAGEWKLFPFIPLALP